MPNSLALCLPVVPCPPTHPLHFYQPSWICPVRLVQLVRFCNLISYLVRSIDHSSAFQQEENHIDEASMGAEVQGSVTILIHKVRVCIVFEKGLDAGDMVALSSLQEQRQQTSSVKFSHPTHILILL